MDYQDSMEAAGAAASVSHSGSNQIGDSDGDDGTNWGRLAAESSQSGSGAKRKRTWPSKGRYGGAKRKKSNSPKKRKIVRKVTGSKKTPAKAKKALGTSE